MVRKIVRSGIGERSRRHIAGTLIQIKGEKKIMSKGQNNKKDSKKVALKTMAEKKTAKREKKNEKLNRGILNQ
jgi:hypothetical protein